jgi:hypothetical protein
MWAALSHLDLADRSFQLIIRPWQAFDIVASEHSAPKAAKDLVDMLGNAPIFCVCFRLTKTCVRGATRGQANQIAANSLRDTGAGLRQFSLRVEQVFQVNQPLALLPIAFNSLCKGQATPRHCHQTAQKHVGAFFWMPDQGSLRTFQGLKDLDAVQLNGAMQPLSRVERIASAWSSKTVEGGHLLVKPGCTREDELTSSEKQLWDLSSSLDRLQRSVLHDHAGNGADRLG